MKLKKTILVFTVLLPCIALGALQPNRNFEDLLERNGLFSAPFAALGEARESLSPVQFVLENPEHKRIIEPTSPVLGYPLVKKIRKSEDHPAEIYKEILNSNPEMDIDLSISLKSYLEAMSPELEAYCDGLVSTVPPVGGWTRVDGEGAAIPLESLIPAHDRYRENMEFFGQNIRGLDFSYDLFREHVSGVAGEYRKKEETCSVVKKISDLEAKAMKICVIGCKKLVKLNQKISSAEAAFPRRQFSINGFTLYVYDELLKLDYLEEVLKVVYDAENEWLRLRKENLVHFPFFSFVINKTVRAGFSERDAIYVLAYSTRNMPSLDVQYGEKPLKAMLLETYFWKFRDIRDILSKKYLQDVFPYHKFERNPGFYHYMTASLLSYEVKRAGYSSITARLMAILSKVAYKTHKLLKALKKDRIKKDGISYVVDIMKRQGYRTGIMAGRYGGKLGVECAKKHIERLKKIPGTPEYEKEQRRLERFRRMRSRSRKRRINR